MIHINRETAMIADWINQDTPWASRIDDASSANGDLAALGNTIKGEFIDSLKGVKPTFYRDYILASLDRVDWTAIAATHVAQGNDEPA